MVTRSSIPSTMMMNVSLLLLVSLFLSTTAVVVAFTTIGVVPTTSCRQGHQQRLFVQQPEILSAENDTSSASVFYTMEELEQEDPVLANAEILDLTLSPHRPLGCTIEESLPTGNYLFVSKVTAGSRGELGGLQVGDVILACSGLFGGNDNDGNNNLQSVAGGQSLETLIGLVQARPDYEALELRIARGTPVLELHEAALVELCANPGATSSEIELCLLDYLKESYPVPTFQEYDSDNCEDEENCLLDDAFDLWNQDFDVTPVQTSTPEETSEQAKAKVVKPWSSRSSPSGTYVRDPVTGQMRNIDA